MHCRTLNELTHKPQGIGAFNNYFTLLHRNVRPFFNRNSDSGSSGDCSEFIEMDYQLFKELLQCGSVCGRARRRSESLSAIVESFRAVVGDGALDAETGPEADEWRKVEKNLEECNRTLQELEQALQRIKKSKGSAITRKWKYDTESVNIKFYKEQIANYKVSLQISFQVLDLYPPLDSNMTYKLVSRSVE